MGMSLTISDTALATAVIRLREAGCVFAEDEAQVLREAAPDDDTLAALVDRRAKGEPLEQVVGHADFAGIRVHLRPGVFVPRVRSELLVTVAARHHPDVLLDLCCGSGALGLAVRHRVPTLDLYAADLDPTATACARDNGIPHVFEGDLYAPLPGELHGRVDVLIANVPYVATAHIPLLPAEARDHEPHLALDGGSDGLDVFRRVAAGAPTWLAGKGVLLSEITEAQERNALEAILRTGLDGDVIYDEDLDARVIRARRR
jgi:release factor glutamine methyltransferase